MQFSVHRFTPWILAVIAITAGVAGAEARPGRALPAAASPTRASGASRAAPSPDVVSFQGACSTEVWFSPVPRPFANICGPLALVPAHAADVNADGISETFHVANTNEAATACYFCQSCDPQRAASMTIDALCNDSAPLPVAWEQAVRFCRATVGPSGPALESVGILDIPVQVAADLLASVPVGGPTCEQKIGVPRWAVQCKLLGWLDCDGDRDLDFVIAVELTKYTPYALKCDYCMANCEVVQRSVRWFENTGFEASPARPPADVNGDGTVNGADLAEVLGNWSP